MNPDLRTHQEHTHKKNPEYHQENPIKNTIKNKKKKIQNTIKNPKTEQTQI